MCNLYGSLVSTHQGSSEFKVRMIVITMTRTDMVNLDISTVVLIVLISLISEIREIKTTVK